MRQYLAIFSAVVFLSPLPLFASVDTLNSTTIKHIHEKVKNSFFDQCKTDMEGGSDAICACVAETAQASLDDDALGKCTNDEKGVDCIGEIVAAASKKASSQEVVTECMQQNEPTRAAEAAEQASQANNRSAELAENNMADVVQYEE